MKSGEQVEDALLIRRIKQGDEAAFEALVRRHYKNVYAFCFRRCGDRELAADLAQEVFLRLVTAVYRYSLTGRFTNYLLTIAVNVCNDYYRRRRPDGAQLLELTGLNSAADKKLRSYSDGMRQRIGIAQALINDPRILILDEPTSGLDPAERAKFRNVISSLSKERIILLSTHIVSDVEYIADRIVLMKNGQA